MISGGEINFKPNSQQDKNRPYHIGRKKASWYLHGIRPADSGWTGELLIADWRTWTTIVP